MNTLLRVRSTLPLALVAALTMGQNCFMTSGGGNNNSGDSGNNTNNDTNNNNNNTTQDPPPKTGLASETQRDAIQSQCAQNFIACTVTYPQAHAGVVAATGQQVSLTTRGTAPFITKTYHVQGTDHSGSEFVHLVSNSTPGQGAVIILYQWTAGASDKDPKTLAPGPVVISDQPNPVVELQTGLHYIRLYIQNSNRETIVKDGETIAVNVNLYDFDEIEVEVRD